VSPEYAAAKVNGDPVADGLQVHVADVPEIVTAPDVPHEEIAVPPAENVTVPV
jgi:hypothetical protein